MKRLSYSAEAVLNLKEIFDHIETNFSKRQASDVVNAIFEKIASLERMPYLGRISEVSESVREFVVKGNVIFYHLTDTSIEIVYIKPRKTIGIFDESSEKSDSS